MIRTVWICWCCGCWITFCKLLDWEIYFFPPEEMAAWETARLILGAFHFELWHGVQVRWRNEGLWLCRAFEYPSTRSYMSCFVSVSALNMWGGFHGVTCVVSLKIRRSFCQTSVIIPTVQCEANCRCLKSFISHKSFSACINSRQELKWGCHWCLYFYHSVPVSLSLSGPGEDN